MVRKRDHRGRDRTRSIQLDGRVTEIAEDLAEQGKLSATISDLLFEKFGHKSQKAKLEAKFLEIDEQIQDLMQRQESVRKSIEIAENTRKKNAKYIDEVEIKLESMIKALRETEAMIQTGNTHNKHGQSYKKIKKTQSDMVEKYRRILEEFA